MTAVSIRLEPLNRNRAALLILSGLVVATAPAAALPDAEVQALFGVLDADGDGVVQRSEYEMHKVEALFGRDRDRDGRLVLDETRASPEVFNRLDADGDGQLSGSELVLSPELQFSGADRDGDGALTRAEFEELLDQLTQ